MSKRVLGPQIFWVEEMQLYLAEGGRFVGLLKLDCRQTWPGKRGWGRGGAQAERWKAEVLHIDDLKLSLQIHTLTH